MVITKVTLIPPSTKEHLMFQGEIIVIKVSESICILNRYKEDKKRCYVVGVSSENKAPIVALFQEQGFEIYDSGSTLVSLHHEETIIVKHAID